MGCLGVHFAIDCATVDALRSQPTDEARLDYLQEEIESSYFTDQKDWLAETDKAWDAIHRTLTDGTMGWNNGEFPLSHVIMGGESFYESDDYIMVLKTPWEVKRIAEALRGIAESVFHERYFRINPEDYYFMLSQDDYEYTWNWFQTLREFYYRAADADRFVLFTASQ